MCEDEKTQELIERIKGLEQSGEDLFDLMLASYIKEGYEYEKAVGGVTEEVLAIADRENLEEGEFKRTVKEVCKRCLVKWIKKKGYEPSDFGIVGR